jgi:hypothetical protein
MGISDPSTYIFHPPHTFGQELSSMQIVCVSESHVTSVISMSLKAIGDGPGSDSVKAGVVFGSSSAGVGAGLGSGSIGARARLGFSVSVTEGI